MSVNILVSEFSHVCDNVRDKFCNENVHNIIYEMMRTYPRYISERFIGGLFEGPYRIFEDNECIQYIQEFVPFHLPQIQNGIEPVLVDIYTNLSCRNDKPLRILDLGSGPGTTTLALCRILNNINKDLYLNVTTLEASTTFNNLIKILKRYNSENKINIIEQLFYTFNDFLNDSIKLKGRFDWIIAANFISAVGDNVNTINDRLNSLLLNLITPTRPIYFTFIETNMQLPRQFMQKESIGSTNLFKKILFTQNVKLRKEQIMNCKFYKTRNNNFCPYINTKTMRLNLK